LACPPFESAEEAFTATFTSDGLWVPSASYCHTARAWDWRTSKPLTPPVPVGSYGASLAMTPDGKHAGVGGFAGALVMLDRGDLASDKNSALLDAQCLGTELLVGKSLHFVDQPLVGQSSAGDRPH
jgi:hypothetical protein